MAALFAKHAFQCCLMTGAWKWTGSEGAVVSNPRVETLATSVLQPLPLRKIHPCIHIDVATYKAQHCIWSFLSVNHLSTAPSLWIFFSCRSTTKIPKMWVWYFLLGSLFLGRSAFLGGFKPGCLSRRADFISQMLVMWLNSALSCTDVAAIGAVCSHPRTEHGPGILVSCKCSWRLNRGHVELLA